MNAAKAETPVLWPPHAKSWLIGKDSDAGRDWGHEEKGTTEDEMAGWHHWLNGHESESTPGVDDGQGVLVCCNSWGREKSDMTEQLNWLTCVIFRNLFILPKFCFLSLAGMHYTLSSVQFSSVAQFTNSQSSPKLRSIESVMPSSHLIFCCPVLLLPQTLPASESFPMSQLFTRGGQRIGVSALASVLPKNT